MKFVSLLLPLVTLVHTASIRPKVAPKAGFSRACRGAKSISVMTKDAEIVTEAVVVESSQAGIDIPGSVSTIHPESPSRRSISAKISSQKITFTAFCDQIKIFTRTNKKHLRQIFHRGIGFMDPWLGNGISGRKKV